MSIVDVTVVDLSDADEASAGRRLSVLAGLSDGDRVRVVVGASRPLASAIWQLKAHVDRLVIVVDGVSWAARRWVEAVHADAFGQPLSGARRAPVDLGAGD